MKEHSHGYDNALKMFISFWLLATLFCGHAQKIILLQQINNKNSSCHRYTVYNLHILIYSEILTLVVSFTFKKHNLKKKIDKNNVVYVFINRHLGYERVYLPLREVADTPFHIQGDDILYLYTCIFMSYQWDADP